MFIRHDFCFVVFFLEVLYCLCHRRHLLWDDFVPLWTIFVLFLHYDLRVVNNHISLYTEHIHTHEVYVGCRCMCLKSKVFPASALIRVSGETVEELQLQYLCEVNVHFANMKVDVDEKKERVQLELSCINFYSSLNWKSLSKPIKAVQWSHFLPIQTFVFTSLFSMVNNNNPYCQQFAEIQRGRVNIRVS